MSSPSVSLVERADGAGREATGWWLDAVIYELHIRAFADSNADGIGDIPGLIGRLGYLQELGVTAIWLLPFYPSPLRDGGYDIADFKKINPAYGDLRSFRRLLDEAHRRGLRVITELVFNHTSDQHPWFQRARTSPAGSRWRDFYVWSDTMDRYRDARVIFQDFETSNWSWDPVAGAYFWHRFYSHQPDLNYDNPEVEAEMLAVLDHWLELGVDGIRLDAIPYLYERNGTSCENLPETHGFLRRLRAHVDARYRDRMLLAEANQWPEDAAAYFGSGDECHMNFNFPLMPRLYMALRQENRLPIVDILDQTPALPEGCAWATFLRNHDELTLEMVSDEERDYMYRSYASDPQARLNLGIRRRLAPLLGNDRQKIELLNALLFSLPGTPVLYYGDEIGMGDNIYLGDRDGVRTPMQWSADRNGGFSRASPHQLYLPTVADGPYRHETLNVELQEQDPHSLLSWMRQLIAVRRRLPVLANGALVPLEPDNHRVLAFVREGPTGAVLVVANLSHRAQPVELDLHAYADARPIEVFGRTEFAPIGVTPYPITLAPHGFYWFELVPASTQQALGADSPPQLPGSTRAGTPPEPGLTAAVTAWIAGRPWFPASSLPIGGCSLELIGTEDRNDGVDLLLYVATIVPPEGDPERYFVPLARVPALAIEPSGRTLRSAVVAWLDNDLVLVDAVADADAALRLAGCLTRPRRGSAVAGLPSPELRRALHGAPSSGIRILAAEQSNSSFVVDDRVIVKVLRPLPGGTSIDAEVSRHLDRAGFTQHSAYLGELGRRGRSFLETLAIASAFVPSDSDAWEYVLDRLGLHLDDPHAEPGDLGATGPELALLGQRLGELHLALATPCGDPAFEPEPLTTHMRRALYQSLRTQLRATLSLLQRRRTSIPSEFGAAAAAVVESQDRFLAHLEVLRDRPVTALRIRTHGDLHLGQILHTGRDFAFIDFEGDPSRSLSERRLKRSPLTDLAGIVRSFDDAGQMALLHRSQRGLTSPATEAVIAQRTAAWCDAAIAAVISGYAPKVRSVPGLLPSGEAGTALLDLFVFERALEDVRYEFDHDPGLLGLPLAALLTAAHGGGHRADALFAE